MEKIFRLGQSAHPTGKDEYIFLAPGTKEKVIRTAVWETISLYNQEWRLVLAYKPYADQ